MINKTFYKLLPWDVKAALVISEGWLVGSSIKCLLESKPVKDYDIVVPSRELFQNALIHLKSRGKVSITTFGASRAKINDIVIDIWCEELDHFLQSSLEQTYIFNIRKQLLLKSK